MRFVTKKMIDRTEKDCPPHPRTDAAGNLVMLFDPESVAQAREIEGDHARERDVVDDEDCNASNVKSDQQKDLKRSFKEGRGQKPEP